MSSVPKVGWYIYTPTDPKKPKLTLRWATVNDFWLEISPKPSEPPSLTIHLGFSDFRPPQPQDNAPVNALILTTDANSLVGPFSITLSTNNRFDILDLNQALVEGRECWGHLLRDGIPTRTFESSFKDKKSGFLGGKNVECSISPQGFKTLRSATEMTIYQFSQVSFVRPLPYDTRQGACFEMAMERGNQKPEMLFQCHDHAEMKQFMQIFLYLLVKDREARVSDAPPTNLQELI
ncbi:hypothetical protein TRFO_08042 [Tritrichomonas foetus]|uniref:Uncharacterized protein n=1 Tax=Tritrichomonas foetus TaxID=1144522 RepID=A0A1J4JLV1_9EUKA|nr:hypothetical protein TRFO_08042 [Tritrichomonas foetus]|eukprot:OHT00089.1 hypothetical protein TRFO_08042 [Tritrichomonas foetus]